MLRRRSLCICILLFAAAYLDVRATPVEVTSQLQPQAAPRAVIDMYCVSCHNERLKTAGLVLDKADVDHAGANPAVWEKVLRKLRTQEMPPAGRPRPDSATYTAVSAVIEK